MANTDVTRVDAFSQKKGVCQAVIRVGKDEYGTFSAAGNYKAVLLPKDAIITDAYVHTLIVSDAAAVTVGTTEGGTEILSAGDSTALGKTGTFTGQSATGTGKEMFVSIAAPATIGDFVVVVEYCEFTKNTGEYTQIN